MFEANPVAAAEWEAVCLQGYLKGLRAAGWHGHSDEVRTGYLTALVLRYALGVLVPVLEIALNPDVHAVMERIMRRPIDAIVANTGATMAFLEQRTLDARRLLGCARS